jgi:hypothetical protein
MVQRFKRVMDVSRAIIRPVKERGKSGDPLKGKKPRTERDVELERQANNRSIRVEQADRFSTCVNLRMRGKKRTVHLDGAFLAENAAELVVDELSVRVGVDLGLQTRASAKC